VWVLIISMVMLMGNILLRPLLSLYFTQLLRLGLLL
jgi:hypothetical protein